MKTTFMPSQRWNSRPKTPHTKTCASSEGTFYTAIQSVWGLPQDMSAIGLQHRLVSCFKGISYWLVHIFLRLSLSCKKKKMTHLTPHVQNSISIPSERPWDCYQLVYLEVWLVFWDKLCQLFILCNFYILIFYMLLHNWILNFMYFFFYTWRIIQFNLIQFKWQSFISSYPEWALVYYRFYANEYFINT